MNKNRRKSPGVIRRLLVMACLMGTGFTGLISADSPGSAGFSFLRIEPDGRSIGMGGAVVSVIDDVFAAWWNPAGLGVSDRISAGVSQVFWFSDINFSQVATAARLGKAGTFALSFGTLYMFDSIEALDLSGNPLNKSVAVNAWSAALSWGAKITSFRSQSGDTAFYLGATAKLVSETLFTYSKSLAAVDIGIRGESILVDGVNIGIVFYNIGPSFTLGSGVNPEYLPFFYTLGISYNYSLILPRFLEVRITPAVDIEFMSDYPPVARFGIESAWRDILHKFTVFIRLGYIYPQDNGTLASFRAGVGFQFKGFTLDYSAAPYGDIDTVHRLTFKFSVP